MRSIRLCCAWNGRRRRFGATTGGCGGCGRCGGGRGQAVGGGVAIPIADRVSGGNGGTVPNTAPPPPDLNRPFVVDGRYDDLSRCLPHLRRCRCQSIRPSRATRVLLGSRSLVPMTVRSHRDKPLRARQIYETRYIIINEIWCSFLMNSMALSRVRAWSGVRVAHPGFYARKSSISLIGPIPLP